MKGGIWGSASNNGGNYGHPTMGNGTYAKTAYFG